MANRGRTYDPQVFSIHDLQRLASEKLSTTYREYYNEGAMDLLTLRDNEKAYDRYKIRPRVLKDVSNIDSSVTLFGARVKFPFGFSPTAMQKLAHEDGEVGTSRAAASVGVPMALSCYSTIDLESVISHGKGNPYIMQLSLLKNREAMIQMVERAEKAGYKALFLTLDAPYLGRRLNEFRNSFGLPEGMEYPNLFPGVDVSNLEDAGDSMAYGKIDPTPWASFEILTWADIETAIGWAELIAFFRKHTKMQIWGKGVYTPEDVELAIQHGFDGVVISNHGGRQLDGSPATLDALRDCAPVAEGRILIAIDGGIRRGTDIFKAIALGADFCFAGRPAIWGLAYAGEKGVKLALDILYDEFITCMALAGCRSVADITKGHLALLQPDGVLAKL
ncbi:(S)-2-hydroxy-acid oxidase [Geosmithia morbida]|uniref:Oxidase FUB9 n=1 Tax=Geosmithia morbida TaxID=1094350 RepID=A0A9P4Z2V8_9HYPO|nr:(S)-2-hydroxy-acid oxidase [Geosmithia morbida]KAF4126442.1 (S)-2-hydroxy-acid oxidase [Geosmithia morbida]